MMWWSALEVWRLCCILTFPFELRQCIPVSCLSLEGALFCLESEKEAVLDKTEEKNPFSGK